MWLWACLVPHPPIIIPDVGRGREKEAEKTLEGFRLLNRTLKGREPEVLLVLSPHAPAGRGFCLSKCPRYRGDLGNFGASGVSLDLDGAEEALWINEILAPSLPITLSHLETMNLDHGALVPLLMLQALFSSAPRIILANPTGLSMEEAVLAGSLLRENLPEGRWALVASGDLSHRLDSMGPYGFHPDGAVFDRTVQGCLEKSLPDPLISLPVEVVENAGQCGLQSVLLFLGLAGRDPVKLHSYEAPFGVGYATASWRNIPAPVALARENIISFLSFGHEMETPEAKIRFGHWPLWDSPAACFVSLKTRDDKLRGCMGTLKPVTDCLGHEILRNSLLAACQDPRFPPLAREELDSFSLSVDVLGPLEKVTSTASLDPRKWGVVVMCGARRGVLLPDLAGIDTVTQQLDIARNKAGLSSDCPFEMYRFGVTRYSEWDEKP